MGENWGGQAGRAPPAPRALLGEATAAAPLHLDHHKGRHSASGPDLLSSSSPNPFSSCGSLASCSFSSPSRTSPFGLQQRGQQNPSMLAASGFKLQEA